MISLPGTPIHTSTPIFWNRPKINFNEFFAEEMTLDKTPVILQHTPKRPVNFEQKSRPISAPPFPTDPINTKPTDKTPHCARPTKSWLARIQKQSKAAEYVPPKKKTSKSTPEERRNIWKRLWMARGNREAAEKT